jgi:hypothetical protein
LDRRFHNRSARSALNTHPSALDGGQGTRGSAGIVVVVVAVVAVVAAVVIVVAVSRRRTAKLAAERRDAVVVL